MLESIIWDNIVQHMKSNELFSKNQYGFISKRSAALQLLNVLQKWCNILDEDGTISRFNNYLNHAALRREFGCDRI